MHRREADEISGVLPRLDGAGEFGEDRCEPLPSIDIAAEFIVTATKVLHERVPCEDDRGGPVMVEMSPRPQAALELAMVGLDRVVGVLLAVVPTHAATAHRAVSDAPVPGR